MLLRQASLFPSLPTPGCGKGIQEAFPRVCGVARQIVSLITFLDTLVTGG